MIIDKYKPINLDIVLDDKCNLSCIGCIKQSYGYPNEGVDYLGIISNIELHTNESIARIHFTGGEPLLKMNKIQEIVELVNSRYTTTEIFAWSVYSNLTILNSKTITFLQQNKFIVHTSIDGFERENDKIRGEGSWKKTIENISRLKEKNCIIDSVTTTLKDDNFHNISFEFIDFISRLNIKIWRLNIDYRGIDVDFNTVIDKVYSLYQYAIKNNVFIEGTWLYPFKNMISNNKKGFCSSTKGEVLTLQPNGKISLCPFSSTVIGTIHSSVQALENKFVKLKLKQSKLVKNNCSHCFIKDYCQTQCLYTFERSDPNLFEWYCNIYKGLTYKLLGNLLQNNKLSFSKKL